MMIGGRHAACRKRETGLGNGGRRWRAAATMDLRQGRYSTDENWEISQRSRLLPTRDTRPIVTDGQRTFRGSGEWYRARTILLGQESKRVKTLFTGRSQSLHIVSRPSEHGRTFTCHFWPIFHTLQSFAPHSLGSNLARFELRRPNAASTNFSRVSFANRCGAVIQSSVPLKLMSGVTSRRYSCYTIGTSTKGGYSLKPTRNYRYACRRA